MNDLLSQLALESEFFANRERWHGTQTVGPMLVYKEYKPMRDAIEATIYTKVDGTRIRFDVVVPFSEVQNLSLDEIERYFDYLIDRVFKEDRDWLLRFCRGESIE